MKYRKNLYMAAACFLLALLCFAARLRMNGEDLAERIAPQLLRFHILANSNSAADQALKLEVKEMLLEMLADGLAGDAGSNDNVPDSEHRKNGAAGRDSAGGDLPESEKESAGNQNAAEDNFSKGKEENTGSQNAAGGTSEKEKICRYVAAHRRELESAAADFMAAKGYDYGASIRVTRCYFPTKYYGDIVLPCGTYDAVQVTLGDGRGRNWWCLLYPRLCFIDAAHAVVPEESKEELRGLVGEDDYAALLAQDGAHIHIRLRLLDLLADLLSPADQASE